jgi:hypothetical protein
MQRLAQLRQTGLAHIFHPTSEHSRLVHSLGTAYWAAEMLIAMLGNHHAERSPDAALPQGNRARLAYLQASLGDVSLVALARAYALIHDAALLPLGHTLSYQLGYVHRPGSDAQWMLHIIQQILAEIEEVESDEDVRNLAARYLRAVETIIVLKHPEARTFVGCLLWPAEQLPRIASCLTFIDELVTGPISADLIDYAIRDSAGLIERAAFNRELLGTLCVYSSSAGDPADSSCTFRFGFAETSKLTRVDIIDELLGLLEVRLEVLSVLAYGRGKRAADTMLDRGIAHALTTREGAALLENIPRLVRMGDDALLDALEQIERSVSRPPRILPIAALRSGRVFEELLTIERQTDVSPHFRALLEQGTKPSARRAFEDALRLRVPELSDFEFGVSAAPRGKQYKALTTLAGTRDGEARSLADMAVDVGRGERAERLSICHDRIASSVLYCQSAPLANRTSLANRIFNAIAS